MPPIGRHFRRVTTSNTLIEELDGLRGVAVLAVVLFHAAGYVLVKNLANGCYADEAGMLDHGIGWILSHGFLGVQLFFAISGLVVTLPFARACRLRSPEPTLRSFYLRRLTRIEPPYFIALILYFTASQFFTSSGAVLSEYLVGMAYAHNLVYGDSAWAFHIAWSLEIEVQFYLLAPLLARIFRLESALARRVILCLGIAISGWYAAEYRLAASQPPPLSGPLQHGWWLGTELVFFLVGMLAAEAIASKRPRPDSPGRPFAWDILWIIGATMVVQSYRVLTDTGAGMGLLVCGLYLLVLGTFQGSLVRTVLRSSWLSIPGGACYTVYLLHTLLISILGRQVLRFSGDSYLGDMVLVAVPLGITSIALSLLAFPILERPFMIHAWPSTTLRNLRRMILPERDARSSAVPPLSGR